MSWKWHQVNPPSNWYVYFGEGFTVDVFSKGNAVVDIKGCKSPIRIAFDNPDDARIELERALSE